VASVWGRLEAGMLATAGIINLELDQLDQHDNLFPFRYLLSVLNSSACAEK